MGGGGCVKESSDIERQPKFGPGDLPLKPFEKIILLVGLKPVSEMLSAHVENE